MLAEYGRIRYTEFPQNKVNPLQLYTALYASQIETIPSGGLNIIDKCNIFLGRIQKRNTEYMEAYFCGPLTSAGAIRIPNNSESPFKQNVIVAETLRDALIPHLDSESQGLRVHLTVPGHIGIRNISEEAKWGEGEYNLFWLYYLSGIDPISARRFGEKGSTINTVQIINNKSLRREEYKPAYQAMVDDFITLAKSPNSGFFLNKIAKMIILPDNQHSFGSQMEIRLALGIGIPVEEVHVNPQWIKDQPQLWFNQYHRLNRLDEKDFILPEDNSVSQVSLYKIN